jgi:fimbrial chaperone protein
MKPIQLTKIWRSLTVIKTAASGLVLILFLVNYTAAATFDINPVRIFLDPETKIEKITLKNTSEDILTLQVKPFQWTTDEKGQDIYTETTDLIFYPKIITLKKGEEKIIRIGTNQKFGSTEKTYRIYLEEIPNADKPLPDNTIRFLLRLGIPVYLSPTQKDEKGAIEAFTLQKGKAAFTVKNKGNMHISVTSLLIKGLNNQGREIFSKDLGAWIIMNGLALNYETAIPSNVCQEMSKLELVANTTNEKFILKEQFEVKKSMCGGQSI